MTNPVRLDDLIEAIENRHSGVLDQLSNAVIAVDKATAEANIAPAVAASLETQEENG